MILIIINPVSGKGNSVSIFNDKIKPYINNYDSYITQYKGHAIEIINDYNLIAITNIILIGGDGLIHEAVQGLVKRKEYNIPINIVPSGSGNGLAKSLNINNIKDSIKFIKNNDKSDIKLVDLFKVSYNLNTEYSFLSQTWTMISDIDIDTEWLRWMGDLRFFWGILKFLFKNKSVRGRLKYKLTDKIYEEKEGDFTLFCASNTKWITNDFKLLPYADMNDKLIDIIYILNYTMTFFEKIRLLYYCLKGDHIQNCKFIKYVKTSEYNLTEMINEKSSCIVIDGEVINSRSIEVEQTNKELKFIGN